MIDFVDYLNKKTFISDVIYYKGIIKEEQVQKILLQREREESQNFHLVIFIRDCCTYVLTCKPAMALRDITLAGFLLKKIDFGHFSGRDIRRAILWLILLELLVRVRNLNSGWRLFICCPWNGVKIFLYWFVYGKIRQASFYATKDRYVLRRAGQR